MLSPPCKTMSEIMNYMRCPPMRWKIKKKKKHERINGVPSTCFSIHLKITCTHAHPLKKEEEENDGENFSGDEDGNDDDE